MPVYSYYVTAEPEPPVYEEVVYLVGGDFKVIAEGDSEALIQAKTLEGGTNTSEVLICADGSVTVDAKVQKDLFDRWQGGIASIEALAEYGYSNTASVGIGAKGFARGWCFATSVKAYARLYFRG